MADHLDPTPTVPVDPDTVAPARGPLHVRPSAIAAVALGGLLGAPARYGLGLVAPTAAGGWPATTFAINVFGAFALGWLLEALTRSGPDAGWRRRVRLCVGTGLLGAFTTYSTLALDVSLLARDHRPWTAIGYGVGSVVAGLAATAIGIAAGAWSAEAMR